MNRGTSIKTEVGSLNEKITFDKLARLTKKKITEVRNARADITASLTQIKRIFHYKNYAKN